MGCTVTDKNIRTHRRNRMLRNESDSSSIDKTGVDEKVKSEVQQSFYESCLASLNENSNRGPRSTLNAGSSFDDNGWGYCTEERLEELLLKNLGSCYNDAISKLVALGYDEEVVLKAILRNGSCFGGMDVFTNILHNSLTYLNSSKDNEENDGEQDATTFLNLRQLEEHSLSGMLSLLQQVRPHLTKGDAMRCLLMSELHINRANVMEIPVPALPGGSGSPDSSVGEAGQVGVASGLCRFHGGWGFGNYNTSEMTLQREIVCPKRFNLSPPQMSLLKRNVSMFAAGFSANAPMYNRSPSCPSSLSIGDCTVAELTAGLSKESQYGKNQDAVNSVMNKFRDLNLDESTEQVPLDQKDEMILNLVHQIKDLEKQVQEHKDWAHQKAIQAARKLSHDLIELKTLKMERDETQKLKKGEHTLENSTLKRLSDMENALRKASGQVDRANAAVRKRETENAEIKAEMEASKLSASESVTASLEVAKREKKFLKKLLTREKQKIKMQEDIAAEKRKISELQKELALIDAATKDAEAKWKQEQKSKELLLEQLEEERRLKEDLDANNKWRLESLHIKMEIDFQRHKDDLQRLKQEYDRLKESVQIVQEHQSDDIWVENFGLILQGEPTPSLLNEANPLGEDSPQKETTYGRECMICLKDEVSVVFLPCAHQVLCAKCNEKYGKKGKAKCPYCRAPVEQRIRVYGTSS